MQDDSTIDEKSGTYPELVMQALSICRSIEQGRANPLKKSPASSVLKIGNAKEARAALADVLCSSSTVSRNLDDTALKNIDAMLKRIVRIYMLLWV
jgi:hypothetical protein